MRAWELASTIGEAGDKEALEAERQRSAELGNALRKANRQYAESREKYVSSLAALEERLGRAEAAQVGVVDSLTGSMQALMDRTAAMLAGRKGGGHSEAAKRRAVSHLPMVSPIHKLNQS
jgi:vacuolar-type H+-ATPase subunit E/Vma4